MIRTARLKLRELQTDDAQRIAVLGGDWDVARMTGRIPYPYSAEAALDWVLNLAPGEVVFGIDRRDELIGICGYSPIGPGLAELGYWIGKPYWGQGFAPEAAAAVVSHGFTRGGVKRFVCCHFDDNAQSERVAAKLGFRTTGRCLGWSEARNEHLPAVSYERRRTWATVLKSTALKALAS